MPNPESLKAAQRAVSRIRAYGIDGPRPIEELEALVEHGDDADAGLEAVLRGASADDLVAAIHLVSLLRRGAVLDAVRDVAFSRPSSLEAKREAVEALRRCDVEPDAEVLDKLAAIEDLSSAPTSDVLAALLDWPAAWREPALSAWLAAAGAEQLSSVQVALGIQPELDARLLDWVASHATPEAAQVLQQFLADAGDKERVKQVKKALQRLRSQGVQIEEPAADRDG